MKILFVCRGNVGRSQMAEAVFKKYSDMDVVSAGTRVPTEGPGKEGKELKDIPVAEPVIRCLLEKEGVDGSHYKNKQVREVMLQGVDKIVIMAELETVPEYLLHDERSTVWAIDDPLKRSYDYNCQILAQIKSRVLELIEEINKTPKQV